ncbi:MAG: porin [Gammaproteobacteria bacterium]|nr:porin [Gammaproteobacteria bacterium]
MKRYTTKLTAALSTLALAGALSLPTNAAVVLGGADGWEVSYGGFINLFYTQSDFEWIAPDAAGNTSEDSAHLNEGLLPAFHTMTVKSPEVNGLTGTGQITFAVDSSNNKRGRLNKNGTFGTDSNIDMREVFFNVAGDFGTISVGRTLALFGRQSILKDITLFGMGALVGPDGSGTGLGRIGYGYVYPDFRTRLVYQTPDMNGFQLSVGIFDPQEPGGLLGTAAGWFSETDTPQFQAEATFNSAFEGGNFSGWAGFIWQEQEITGSPAGGEGDIETVGWNIGAEVSAEGFGITGQYYDGEALGVILHNSGGGFGFNCHAMGCTEADNDGFYVQASYTFNGTTKIGGGYGESRQDANMTYNIDPHEGSLWTVGVYHDVNSWLKVIAEYGNYDHTILNQKDVDTFSIGGFLLW